MALDAEDVLKRRTPMVLRDQAAASKAVDEVKGLVVHADTEL